MSKPSSSGNILNQENELNTNQNQMTRPFSQNPGDFRASQSTKALAANPSGQLPTTKYGMFTSGSEIYVKKWVDYSTKYGLGYLLSNGFTGVFFNDSTKVILDTKSGYTIH
jgi:polo-like kinase 1